MFIQASKLGFRIKQRIKDRGQHQLETVGLLLALKAWSSMSTVRSAFLRSSDCHHEDHVIFRSQRTGENIETFGWRMGKLFLVLRSLRLVAMGFSTFFRCCTRRKSTWSGVAVSLQLVLVSSHHCSWGGTTKTDSWMRSMDLSVAGSGSEFVETSNRIRIATFFCSDALHRDECMLKLGTDFGKKMSWTQIADGSTLSCDRNRFDLMQSAFDRLQGPQHHCLNRSGTVYCRQYHSTAEHFLVLGIGLLNASAPKASGMFDCESRVGTSRRNRLQISWIHWIRLAKIAESELPWTFFDKIKFIVFFDSFHGFDSYRWRNMGPQRHLERRTAVAIGEDTVKGENKTVDFQKSWIIIQLQWIILNCIWIWYDSW